MWGASFCVMDWHPNWCHSPKTTVASVLCLCTCCQVLRNDRTPPTSKSGPKYKFRFALRALSVFGPRPRGYAAVDNSRARARGKAFPPPSAKYQKYEREEANQQELSLLPLLLVRPPYYCIYDFYDRHYYEYYITTATIDATITVTIIIIRAIGRECA